ncbi:MBL fold metallo-hydrolase [Glycomyces sp. TRM65418]|uniref:MBL fold metallo-hydrolase n=1 Tax=Glycomyces sp. TRM65418 TaxID=2867006 RepID=UPI001CE55865|nr:MBL fold metallo-hydrolase [Glycomyces sp. TRM65418]MCC3762131.1 MBL fold metallo-hydrolase [Glycomyces sp. TRM65418]QZD56195.1 MBL fold metallo-hydrolase [Glycomyces sp. TRM65418]
MSDRWIEVADRVWVRRLKELDQSLGLVIGDDSCLVIDTGIHAEAGYAFATAVRELTDLPWQVAYTHDHFDHWFGTSAFGESAIWAVEDGAAYISRGDRQRKAWAATYRRQGREEDARRIGRSPLVPPNCRVSGAIGLNLGGRTVVLRRVGLAHTDNDMVIEVPDAGVLFAGDLLENGAPPSYDAAFPLEWPQAVEYLLSWRPAVVVPGHGEPADYWWARGQTRDLAEVAKLCAEVAQGLIPEGEAIEHGPFGAATMRTALDRWRELAPPPPEPAPQRQTDTPAGTPPPPVIVYDVFDYSIDLTQR